MAAMRSAAASLVALACLATGAAKLSSPPDRLAAAATAFLSTLDTEQRSLALLPFAAPARQDWHYIPRTRAGIKFSQLSDTSRQAAHTLLRTVLSSRGYLKATTIFQLEQLLYDMEVSAGHDPAWRDPGNYTVAFFGDPAAGSPWGWKFEGHHVCLNYTSGFGEHISTTPAFLGSNPATVRTGPKAGLRVLAAEEELGFDLYHSLDEGQRSQALISDTAPDDIVLSPGRPLDLGSPRGVTYASMNADQRALLEQLLGEYVENLQHDLAAQQWSRIREKGLDTVRFAWCGSANHGEPHYYRIHGPSFVIEFDNTQNQANHVHTCWHDLERDFGADLLKDHYDHDHGAPGAPTPAAR